MYFPIGYKEIEILNGENNLIIKFNLGTSILLNIFNLGYSKIFSINTCNFYVVLSIGSLDLTTRLVYKFDIISSDFVLFPLVLPYIMILTFDMLTPQILSYFI